eukprot:1159612-Pelagomonas_calceolata.AAC.6
MRLCRLDIIQGLRKQQQLQLPHVAAAAAAEHARSERLWDDDGEGGVGHKGESADEMAEAAALKSMWRPRPQPPPPLPPSTHLHHHHHPSPSSITIIIIISFLCRLHASLEHAHIRAGMTIACGWLPKATGQLRMLGVRANWSSRWVFVNVSMTVSA